MYESHKTICNNVFLPSLSCGPTGLYNMPSLPNHYLVLALRVELCVPLKSPFLCWWASRSFLRFLWHAADNWCTTVNRTQPLLTIPSINLAKGAKSLETRRDERPFKGIKRLPKILTVRLWATQTSPSTPGERGAGWLFQPRLNVLPLSFCAEPF